MSSLKELLEKRATLDAEIEQARQREAADALAKVRAMVAEYGLTANDIFSGKANKVSGKKVAPKYRNPETGETWTGRGREPKWISGKTRDEFLIP